MAIIVSVIQEKGGTGKSTIATNLVGIAKKGLKVVLIDCDMPQGTSQSWAAIRLKISAAMEQISVGDFIEQLIDKNTPLLPRKN